MIPLTEYTDCNTGDRYRVGLAPDGLRYRLEWLQADLPGRGWIKCSRQYHKTVQRAQKALDRMAEKCEWNATHRYCVESCSNCRHGNPSHDCPSLMRLTDEEFAEDLTRYGTCCRYWQSDCKPDGEVYKGEDRND